MSLYFEILELKNQLHFQKKELKRLLKFIWVYKVFMPFFLKSNECQDLLVAFDTHFPNTDLTQKKK